MGFVIFNTLVLDWYATIECTVKYMKTYCMLVEDFVHCRYLPTFHILVFGLRHQDFL